MTVGHDSPPMARPLVAAGALFFDEDGRVLLVKPAYKEGWDIPGGYLEPGESPLQACQREVHEELGIQPTIGQLLAVDWAPVHEGGDKLLFIFDGGHLDDAQEQVIQIAQDELTEWKYHSLATIDAVMPNRLVRRVRSAARAGTDRQVLYLEHGEHVRP
jgi:ADP-ribose pyrophosphatase YjhB (NUDIX family)